MTAPAPARRAPPSRDMPASDAADVRATEDARALAARRLGATRRALLAVAGGRAAGWAAAAGTAAAAGLRLAGAPTGTPVGGRAAWAGAAALAAGLAALARSGGPRAWTLPGVALWLEARVPSLRYALVTLADAGPAPNGSHGAWPTASSGASASASASAPPSAAAGAAPPLPAPVARALAERVRAARWGQVVARAARRALAPPAAALAVAAVLYAAAERWPAAAAPDAVRPARAPGTTATATPAAAPDPLARVRATVTPPAYARRPAETLDDPSGVTALAGSALVLEGAGDPGRVRASLADAGAPPGGGDPGAPGVALGTSPGARAAPAAGPALGVTLGPARPLAVRAAPGGRWRVALAVPPRPALLRLAGPARDRLVVLEPRPDLPPRAALVLPARDTVVRAPTGTLPLRARLDDDLGLADGAFEYVVSSGEGENFTFKSGRLGGASLGNAPRAALAAALDLAALGLKPGDVVHLRAVARDGRPTTAATARDAVGASETRAVRVARAGEYDSVAVEGAPPPEADTTALGQRVILQRTEALVARAESRRAALAPPLVVEESRRLGGDEARLRRRVGDVIFSRTSGEGGMEESQGGADASERRGRLTREEVVAEASRATGEGAGGALEGDESEAPVTAINRPLLEAYNAMWDAGRALEGGEPRRALAPMRRALAALQRARAAERVYLRGRTPAVVIDVDKVRLAGQIRGDTLHPAARDPRAALDPAARARAAALDAALLALARPGPAAEPGRRAAADALALLRVRALGTAPALAAALGDALAALARGADAAPALTRARRAALAPAAPGGARGGAAAWAGAWSDLRP